jgi:protein involved in polysaccharide export with SLBB domain
MLRRLVLFFYLALATAGAWPAAAAQPAIRQGEAAIAPSTAGASATVVGRTSPATGDTGDPTSSMPALHDADDPADARRADWAANAASDMFGAQLFTGTFSNGPAAAFNDDHVVAIGDRIRLRLWGAFEFDDVLTVDRQGNLLLPHGGPLQVAGVAQRALQPTIAQALRHVYTQRVSVYVDLQAAQPVRVFVTGFVRRPGMYSGTAADSVLRYLDEAGGVDPERGTYIGVEIKRGSVLRARIDLYDFLLDGVAPSVALRDGDVIFVGPQHASVRARGTVTNARRFEFRGELMSLSALAAAAKPGPSATHARITRNARALRDVEYLPLTGAASVALADGDEVEFTSDKRPGTITVRVEGEHDGQREYVLPYGTRLGALLAQVPLNARSAPDTVQLFRTSLKLRQKAQLDTALRALEASVLTARSGTEEEARLRNDEAKLVLQWIERARAIEPIGQAVVGQGAVRDVLLLENGDLVRIPSADGLVLVGGEVLFPTALAAVPGYDVDDYIARAGGFAQRADRARVVVAHRDGTFSDGKRTPRIAAGDEILVLPRPDFKTRQFAKDVFQVVYQLALTTKIALGL